MRFIQFTPLLLSLIACSSGQNFCENASHSGKSITEYNNKIGNIGNVNYEIWSNGGNNNGIFYDDGSFTCNINNSKDYLCHSGISFDNKKKYHQLGNIYADFNLNKGDISNADYSYVGVYGWTNIPLVKFYIVDNWLNQESLNRLTGNKKLGEINVNGDTYNVYENIRIGKTIDGNTKYKQYFSIRTTARNCGTIDVTAHFKNWENLGLKIGKLHEIKILAEAGSKKGSISGTIDLPYAKIYINNINSTTNEKEKRNEKINKKKGPLYKWKWKNWKKYEHDYNNWGWW